MSQAAPTVVNMIPVVNAISVSTNLLDTSLVTMNTVLTLQLDELEVMSDGLLLILDELKTINKSPVVRGGGSTTVQTGAGPIGDTFSDLEKTVKSLKTGFEGIQPELIPDTFADDLENAIATLRGGGELGVEGAEKLDILPDEKKTKKAKGAITDMMGSMGNMLAAAGPIGLIIAALEAFGFLQPILAVLNAFISVLSTAFQPILTAVMGVLVALIPPFQMLVDALAPVITMIVDAFSPALDMIVPLFTSVVEVIMPIIDLLIPLIAIFLNLSMALNPVIPIIGMLLPIIELLGSLLGLLLEPIIAILLPIADISAKLVTLTTSLFNLGEIGISGLVDGIKGKLDGLTTIATDAVSNFATNIKEGIENAFDDAIEGITGFGGRLRDTIKGWFN